MRTTISKFTNLDYLKLMADGDKEMEKTMLEMLVVELPDEFAKMKTLFDNNDWEQLGQVSHKMKSTLAFIGNEEMTTANVAIERLSKMGGDRQEIGRMIAIFEEWLPDVLSELNQYIASN